VNDVDSPRKVGEEEQLKNSHFHYLQQLKDLLKKQQLELNQQASLFKLLNAKVVSLDDVRLPVIEKDVELLKQSHKDLLEKHFPHLDELFLKQFEMDKPKQIVVEKPNKVDTIND